MATRTYKMLCGEKITIRTNHKEMVVRRQYNILFELQVGSRHIVRKLIAAIRTAGKGKRTTIELNNGGKLTFSLGHEGFYYWTAKVPVLRVEYRDYWYGDQHTGRFSANTADDLVEGLWEAYYTML